jgi:hypothetical protein
MHQRRAEDHAGVRDADRVVARECITRQCPSQGADLLTPASLIVWRLAIDHYLQRPRQPELHRSPRATCSHPSACRIDRPGSQGVRVVDMRLLRCGASGLRPGRQPPGPHFAAAQVAALVNPQMGESAPTTKLQRRSGIGQPRPNVTRARLYTGRSTDPAVRRGPTLAHRPETRRRTCPALFAAPTAPTRLLTSPPGTGPR